MRVDASKPVAPRARRHEHRAGCQKVARRAVPLSIESVRGTYSHQSEPRASATSGAIRGVLVGRADATRESTMKLQGPVLVGTDFTAASDEALRQAYDVANDLGTRLIVCHVVPDLDTVDVLFPQLAARHAEHQAILTGKATTEVERHVAASFGTTANVGIVVDSGTPHAGLLARADATGAGLIVMG